jgi:hypothetical protein
MAGLVPAIHVFLPTDAKTWMPGTSASGSDAVPSEGYGPGMTTIKMKAR